jgi:hypothetical protein
MKQKEWKPSRQDKSRNELSAYGTMILITAILTAVTLSVIFNIF